MAGYAITWRNKCLTSEAKTIDEMIAGLRDAADRLEQMKAAGISLDPDSGIADDYAELVTTDPKVAEDFGLVDVEADQDEELEDDNHEATSA